VTGPYYADNASEALTILDAARQLIEARLKTLHPGLGISERGRAAKTTPLRLTITIDEGAVLEQIEETHTLKAHSREFDGS
jgi:hypothetical protein